MKKYYFDYYNITKFYLIFKSTYNKLGILALLLLANFSAFGQGWTDISAPVAINPLHFMYDIHFPTATVGYGVGTSGQGGSTIIKTTDAGLTWTKREFTTTNLASIFFTDADNGYASGTQGIIAKTTNGGVNWITVTTGTTNYVWRTCFTDANTGFALVGGNFLPAGNSIILKTTNAGISWASQFSGTNLRLQSIHFPTSTTGYIVGVGGTTLKTTNTGTSWTALNIGANTDLNGIHFTDANIGYVVGASNVIRKTTDGGTSWVPISSGLAANTIFTDVYFTNANTGYICGTNAMLKTTNGGTSWINQSNAVTTSPGAIYCPPGSDIAFAVGVDIKLIRSPLPCPDAPLIGTPTTTSICTASSETLTLNITAPISGTTYLWSNNTTGNSAIINQTGSYSVRAISAGCTSEVSNSIVVAEKAITPIISTPTSTNICSGTSITLNVASPISGTTYLWSNNTTGNSAIVNQAGSYTVRAISAGCTSAVSNAITLSLTNIVSPAIIIPTNTSICNNTALTLNVANPIAGIAYLWSDNSTGNSATINTVGTYSVRAISGTCTSAVSNPITITSTFVSSPVISTPATTSICPGSILTLSVSGPIPGTTYLWSNNTSGTIAQINSSGTFSVRAISAGCSSAASNAITVSSITSLPVVSLVYQNNILSPVFVGDSAGLTYQWLRNDTLVPGQSGRNFQPSLVGNYRIRISRNGCFINSTSILVSVTSGRSAKPEAQILVQIYPNPSSGNFVVETQNLSQNATINIFDALGRSVYESKSLDEKHNLYLKTSGIYLVVIQNGKERIVRKVVVN